MADRCQARYVDVFHYVTYQSHDKDDICTCMQTIQKWGRKARCHWFRRFSSWFDIDVVKKYD